jgi:hypothetical protein
MNHSGQLHSMIHWVQMISRLILSVCIHFLLFVYSIQMEFPTLGRHCSMKSCNQLGMLLLLFTLISVSFYFILDFLPMKCNLCSAVLW